MKKLLCGIMAVFMALSMTSCGDKEESSSLESGSQLVSGAGDGVNMKEEDMPYGATIFQLSTENNDYVKYVTEFDKRYFGGDDKDNPDYSEIYKVHDYVSALNKNDHEAFKALHYDGYLETACKDGGYDDVDTYIDGLYNSLESYLGEGFEINFICVSGCFDDSNAYASDYMKTVDNYLSELNVLDKVTSKKVIEIGGDTCYAPKEGGSNLLVNHMESIIIGVYVIDGQAYIV